jgi:hypothetical protein
MSDALPKLKAFIHTYIRIPTEPVPEAVTDEIKIFVSEAIFSLQWQIDEELWNIKEETLRTQYIRDIQVQLTLLADDLTGAGLAENQPAWIRETVDWVLIKIFQVLDHLHTYFSQYFNPGAALPIQFVLKYKGSRRIQSQVSLESIKEKGTDQELISLLESFILAFDKSEKFFIDTWGQWDYLLNIEARLTDFNKASYQNDANLELLKLIVSQDFNSVHIYAYFTRYFEHMLSAELSHQEQQEELFYLLKIFRQVRIEVSSPYDPGVQSLKTSISDCLLAEIDFLAQKEKVLLQNFQSTSSGKPSRFYFDVVFTLAELMFFFRIMIETGTMWTKFNSHLYEFISAHIRTQRAENLSKKSMRNHFSNKPFPDRIIQKVRDGLVKMIAHIDLYYKDQ